MHKGRLIAIAIGIAIAIVAGVAFAFNNTMSNDQVEPTGTTEGRNIVVNVEEKLEISESP